MERTRDPLPTLQCPRNRPLWRRGSNGLGGFMLDGRTPLHVFERGIVTGARYRDEILEPYVRLFRGAVGPEFILMDDNARPHRALLVDEFLESEEIRRKDWPARSPYPIPIEHVCDALGRAIATRNHLPRTIQEMKTAALLNERDQLPQEMINCLISSMESRCKAYISVRGDRTPH
ncbi:hypothetical protein AVEN_216948-1 [Araneus ventricosus]|uniref:Tc1-like transposase DDE domain-containing protein n=1 Tax=Araneus ventricosus TaxID=182803 RepID=A0A4Y2LXX7_ARAVE|nr:hypothetical protein AVEN_70164-1 [Araneus ventricosus]GBN19319.1 hypothetical protein AVEN_79759-1 [Araneus ventricosus]GBN19372.1 hypothetical protein AVEN_165654-1 [Araneus ventricosus]GBN19393.1 hypothetical protein AVEN_216948-1 [Araneus ventricosus]